MKQKSLLSALVLFLALALSSHWIQRFAWDLPITLWLQSLAQPGIETLMEWVSIPGNGVWRPYVVALIVSIASSSCWKEMGGGMCCPERVRWRFAEFPV